MKQLAKDVKKLKGAADRAVHQNAMNDGDRVDVDYFALCRLIRYYEETRDIANRIMIARDLLHQVYFTFTPENKTAIIEGTIKERTT